MRFKYDKSSDACSVDLTEDVGLENVEQTDSFSIDGFVEFGAINLVFDKNKKIISIEILSASKYLPSEVLGKAEIIG